MPDDFKSFVGTSLRSLERKDYSWFFVFGDSLRIDTESFWRFVAPEGIIVTSEDHGHQFGLPQPVGAAQRVTSRLAGHRIQSVGCDPQTGDLLVTFEERLCLQFLQPSCGYESWRATTPYGESICMGGGEIAYFPATKNS